MYHIGIHVLSPSTRPGSSCHVSDILLKNNNTNVVNARYLLREFKTCTPGRNVVGNSYNGDIQMVDMGIEPKPSDRSIVETVLQYNFSVI